MKREIEGIEIFDENECRKFYRMLGHKNQTELRFIDPNKKNPVFSQWINNEEEFVLFCKNFNGQLNIYAGVNERKLNSKEDENVVSIKFLFLDIDPVRDKDVGSTDEEKEIAENVAWQIIRDFIDRGYQRPCLVDSGNGSHLYFKIPEIEITKDNLKSIKEKKQLWEAEIRKKYEIRGKVRIDAVFNLERIMAVPGTLKMKGENTEERPWRIVKFVDDPSILKEDSKLRDELLMIEPPKVETKEQITFKKISNEEFRKLLERDEKLKDLFEGRWEKYGYPTRSEAEEALVSKLIFYKIPKEQIFRIMDESSIGKWQERPIQYKELTYNKAVKFVEERKTEEEKIAIQFNRENILQKIANLNNKSSEEEINSVLNDIQFLSPLAQDDFFETIKERTKRKKASLKKQLQAIKKNTWKREEETQEKMTNEKIFEIAEQIMNQYTFKTAMDNEIIYVYTDGVYKPKGEVVIKAICQDLLEDQAKVYVVNEVIGHIQRSTYTNRKEFNKYLNLINLKNGFFDVKSRQLIPHTPDIIITSQLPIKYDPKADCPNIKKFLSEILYPDDIPFVQEYFGFAIYRSYFIRKIMIMHGTGGNGKTTLLLLFENFVGDDNSSHISMRQLSGLYDRFARADLYGKLLNTYDELEKETLQDTALFKQSTGGSPIRAEFKGRDSFNFINFAKHIFTCNELPDVKDMTEGFWDRISIITFPYRFVPNPDPENKDERQERRREELLASMITEEELSGLFNWALEGLYRLFERHEFSGTKSWENVRDEWMSKASPVSSFIAKKLVIKSEGTIEKKEVYSNFIDYCKENKLPTIGYQTFCQKLQQNLGSQLSESRPVAGDKRVLVWTGIAIVKKGFAKLEEAHKAVCEYCGEEKNVLYKDNKGAVMCEECYEKEGGIDE